MRFASESRARFTDTVTLSFDPTGSTVEVLIDGTWHPATWQGTALPTGSRWRQAALTTGYFAGPDAAPASSTTVLTVGNHPTKTRVTKGGDVIVADSSPIDIV